MTLSKNQEENETILSHYKFLVDRMTPEFGLIDGLLTNGTLNIRQKNEIEAQQVTEKKNEILLQLIVDKNACKELFEVLKLKKYGQLHLAKYMEENGVYKQEFGENWPLEEMERAILLNNYENLVDILDCNELIGSLYSADVLNKRQRDLISSKTTPYEQNKVLLEILLKGSLNCYRQMIRCLHGSQKGHIAKIFESGGDVVRIDTSLSSELSSLAENCIRTEISKSSEHLDVSCLGMKKQPNLESTTGTDSISLYFLCPEPGDIDGSDQVLSGVQLKSFVEDSLNRLSKLPPRTRERLYSTENIRANSLSKLSNVTQNCVKTNVKTKSLTNVVVSLPSLKKHHNLEEAADTDRDSFHSLFYEPDDVVSAQQMASGSQLETLQHLNHSWPRMKNKQNLEEAASTESDSVYTTCPEPGDIDSAEQMTSGGQLKTFADHFVLSSRENTTVYQPEFGGKWPLAEKESKVLFKNYENLVDILDSRDLVGLLHQTGVLNKRQRDLVSVKTTTAKQNKVLLEILRKGSLEDHLQMIRCLHDSGQSHIARILESGGVYRPEFGGIWPLTDKERTILKGNYETLIDLLDSRDLVGLLYQTGVLNKRQRNLITSKTTSEEQNKLLLESLSKGSLGGYWQTIRCLHLSKQSHVAKIFETGGVVVRIDVNLQSELSNLIEIENSIATEITNLLRNTSLSDAGRIWEKVPLNLVGLTVTHGISLYFLCFHEIDIDRLKQKASDGQLKKFVEDFFNRLMAFPKNIKVTLKWSRHLFSKSRNYIKAIQIKNLINDLMETTIRSLPLDVLDIILQKAYLWSRLKSCKVNDTRDADIIRFLASVDDCWFHRILRKRFKNPIWPQLEKIYMREFEMHFNFRGCQRYLEESMQVGEVGLTRRELVAAGLTDLQIARQQRKHLMKGKRPSLATKNLVDSRGVKEETMYNNFNRYLRQENQTKKATVLEERKATVKVEIRHPRNRKTDDWSREFSSRLNFFKDRNRQKSDYMKKIIHQQENSGLEILDSFVDRGVIVWIWCKSQNAEDNLKVLHKSETLIDHLYLLANQTTRQHICSRDIHLEEFSQIKIERISLQNPVIIFEGEIQKKEAYLAIGVAKLGEKIFVLSHFRSSFRLYRNMYVVHVFDDQHPFILQRKKKFEKIKKANDIASYEKGFSLYIADYEVKCIWKICPPDENKIETGKFTCAALKSSELSRFNYFGMMITDSGQIMIIGDQNSILLFCESESALNCLTRIVLPAYIEQPLQVAENSAGSFIFLHRAQKSISPGDTCQISSRPNEYQWVVSEVGQNCESIIRQYVGTANDWLDPAGEAFLLVDPRGRILLADRNNHRLILLDSRLQHAGSFTLDTDGEDEENRLLLPEKMVYDAGKNQLIVVGDKKVPVYSFSKF